MRIGRLEFGPGGVIFILLIIAGLVIFGLRQMGIDLIDKIKNGTAVTSSGSDSKTPTTSGGSANTIRIKGSSTVGGSLGKDWAQEFMSQHPGSIVLVETKGTSTGFQGLISGEAEIAAASRPVNDKEKDAARAAGFNLDSSDSEYVIGFDAIAVIVNSENPLSQLTTTQLKDIFTGKITDWGQLGGKPGTIKVLLRPKELGAYELFQELVLGKGTPFLSGAEEVKENTKLAEQVRNDRNAIAFIALGGVGANKAIKIAASDKTTPIAPSEVTIRNKSYLLTRNLYLYTRGAPQGLVKEFIDYTLGAGQEYVANNSFVNLKLKLVSASEGGSTSSSTEEKRKKYNTDIRFRTNSTEVNNLAIYDLAQIGRDACSNVTNIQIELIGYSDSQGDPQQNLVLSKQRADAVASVLRSKCPQLNITTSGRGTQSPIGDNNTEEGRLLNRRVEIWVAQN
ncbi:MAG: phosphate ABC transporter substrate-binding/OmpA family protein [Acidobacteriota bacterium]